MKPDPMRLLRPVMIFAVLAAVSVPLTSRMFGATGGFIATLTFVIGSFAWSAPKVYPDGQLRFAIRIPTRIAYRRAKSANWTVSAGLHRHGITPQRVRALVESGCPQNRLYNLVASLDDSLHPDGPFAADMVEALGERWTGTDLDGLLDLPPSQRGDAVAYVRMFDSVRVQDITRTCEFGFPVALADRVASCLPTERSSSRVFSRVLDVWTDPGVQTALGVGTGGRPTNPARLQEHLNEWLDAVPNVAVGRVTQPGDAAEVIAAFGKVPLAGWWHAAGYSPEEAREVAAQRDWSLGQLAALAALRQGPPVAAPTY